MSVRPYRDIVRRKSRQIFVGTVPVGGDAPIPVQTMTNTLTADAKATIAQIQVCADAGADIIRVSCPDEASTAAMPEICKASPIPIVADIHFHYKRAIEAAAAGAAFGLPGFGFPAPAAAGTGAEPSSSSPQFIFVLCWCPVDASS